MQQRLRFLIIDDCESVFMTYTQLLEAAGHEVIALSSCDQALAKVIDLEPDCVLCDLMLPGLDGMQLFKLLSK